MDGREWIARSTPFLILTHLLVIVLMLVIVIELLSQQIEHEQEHEHDYDWGSEVTLSTFAYISR